MPSHVYQKIAPRFRARRWATSSEYSAARLDACPAAVDWIAPLPDRDLPPAWREPGELRMRRPERAAGPVAPNDRADECGVSLRPRRRRPQRRGSTRAHGGACRITGSICNPWPTKRQDLPVELGERGGSPAGGHRTAPAPQRGRRASSDRAERRSSRSGTECSRCRRRASATAGRRGRSGHRTDRPRRRSQRSCRATGRRAAGPRRHGRARSPARPRAIARPVPPLGHLGVPPPAPSSNSQRA